MTEVASDGGDYDSLDREEDTLVGVFLESADVTPDDASSMHMGESPYARAGENSNDAKGRPAPSDGQEDAIVMVDFHPFDMDELAEEEDAYDEEEDTYDVERVYGDEEDDTLSFPLRRKTWTRLTTQNPIFRKKLSLRTLPRDLLLLISEKGSLYLPPSQSSPQTFL